MKEIKGCTHLSQQHKKMKGEETDFFISNLPRGACHLYEIGSNKKRITSLQHIK